MGSLRIAVLCLITVFSAVASATADFDYSSGDDTWFSHSLTSPVWLSGQGNFIFQMNPHFHNPYSGPNSFGPSTQQAFSAVETFYTGLRLNSTTEGVLDVESAAGTGLGGATGLGGLTNIDAVRSLEGTPYLARLWYREVIPLSSDTVEAPRDPLSQLTTLPLRRLDIHVGEFALVDFFDVNDVTGNSHQQFLNWTVVNNGAYDYAADFRGYTWGAVLEYDDRNWAFRFGEVLLPKRANGLHLQKNLQDAHSENYELELRPPLLRDHATVVRLLAYTNFSNMGDYDQAISRYQAGLTPTPEIDDHSQLVSLKYGFGLNAQQEITTNLSGFLRVGWNEGQHETWSYTECDQTLAFGAHLRGTPWRRPRDMLGIAFVANALSANHRRYLALGGLGFDLGDGALSYGREMLMETFYNFPIPLHSGLYGALDFQYIDNPGYNRVRGPVLVPGVRVHVEL
jgi:hypothetical protein